METIAMPTDQASPHILVVEDDDHIAQILKFMLERQGYRTRLVSDGLAARTLIKESNDLPGLILLDVMLPYIDGFEVVQLIRAQSAWKSIPIVMLTAKTMERDIVRALDAGANDYIVKPFQPNELLARVRRFIKVNT